MRNGTPVSTRECLSEHPARGGVMNHPSSFRQLRGSLMSALAAAVAAVAMGAWTAPHAFAQAIQVHLPGNKIPQFVDPLPVLSLDLTSPNGIKTVIAGPGEITLNMLEFKANIMPSTFVAANGPYSGTWTFGYL